MAGAMDMYYLPYCNDLYHRQHVPIHYVLVVGYDVWREQHSSTTALSKASRALPYGEFEKSLGVKVPGMSKRNTIRAFELPERSRLSLRSPGGALRARQRRCSTRL
jgi:hypothetical protein